MLNIFTYTDYRTFLQDFYTDQKHLSRSFSYQIFAKNAGFSTNSYLIDIIHSRKALSKASIYDVAKAMKLKKKETEFFVELVHFAHAKTHKEREYHFQRIKTFAGKTNKRIVGIDQYDFYSKWYHTVIRELVVMKGFNGDMKQLAKKCNPPITPKQAKDSVKLLLDLKMIERQASGKFIQKDPTLHTGDEIAALTVHKFQQESIVHRV